MVLPLNNCSRIDPDLVLDRRVVSCCGQTFFANFFAGVISVCRQASCAQIMRSVCIFTAAVISIAVIMNPALLGIQLLIASVVCCVVGIFADRRIMRLSPAKFAALQTPQQMQQQAGALNRSLRNHHLGATNASLIASPRCLQIESEAKKRFLQLHQKRLCWKQIIDERQHSYGPFVFDLGLNNGGVEPLFLVNAIKASLFAADHFHLEPNIDFYKIIHSIASRDISLGKSRNLKSIGGVGKFRPEITNSPKVSCVFELGLSESFKDGDAEPEDKVISFFNDIVCSVFSELPSFDKSSPPVTISFESFSNIYKQSYTTPLDKIDQLVKEVFDSFNRAIKTAKTNDERIKYIALFYQRLDWIHPFQDGQGRTDIIFLSWLLCKYGFNPPILAEPYYSSMNTLDNWTIYLNRALVHFDRVNVPSSDLELWNHYNLMCNAQALPNVRLNAINSFIAIAKKEPENQPYVDFGEFLPLVLQQEILSVLLNILDYGLNVVEQKTAILFILENKKHWICDDLFIKWNKVALEYVVVHFEEVLDDIEEEMRLGLDNETIMMSKLTEVRTQYNAILPYRQKSEVKK